MTIYYHPYLQLIPNNIHKKKNTNFYMNNKGYRVMLTVTTFDYMGRICEYLYYDEEYRLLRIKLL